MNNLSPGKLISGILGGIVLLFVMIMSFKAFTNVGANELVVIQSPISGSLRVEANPGWTFTNFGSVTHYPRRNELVFADKRCDAKSSENALTSGLDVRFYDGGNAVLCGSISWMMPADEKSVIKIHRDFHSPEAFELQAVKRSMQAAATFSGPTMTSFESAAGRRNELLQLLNDQTLYGVYQTVSKTVHAKDAAGMERDMTTLEIVKDAKGQPLRAQDSYVHEYNVVMLPMTVTHLAYEPRVEAQIKQQQDATNAVNVAAANAKKADQDAVTAEANGRANAARAKWEQEVLNAKTIADAQAKVTIANASVQEAEAYKKAEILKGEGESTHKKLVMEADGQLDKKLATIEAINAKYADAIAHAQPGAWAPGVQMGGNAQGSGDRAMSLVDLLTAKTARELSLDMSVKGGSSAPANRK